MIALQKALYGYIAALASPTHKWLLDEINITEERKCVVYWYLIQ